MEKQTTIMTPVFKGANYLHHLCSECEGTMKFEQNAFGGVSFYAISGFKCEGVKYCPLCGAEIIRFSDKPIYEEAIDISPLDVFKKLYLEYERKTKWLYFCHISEEHRKQIDKLMPLIERGEVSVYYQSAMDIVRKISYFNPSHTAIKKLQKEFGGGV